jgi:hypothetical protein
MTCLRVRGLTASLACGRLRRPDEATPRGPTLALVRYADFRRLHAQRQDANNAMMALLAGSKLAINTLRLADGSTMRQSQMFPRVQHIERFDLKIEDAAQLLDDAETHLAVMAIPYVLALHEDYMLQSASMLVSSRMMSASTLRSLTAKSMHEQFAAASSVTLSANSMLLFHFLRTMRNAHIHQGGICGAELATARSALTATAEAMWFKLAGTPAPHYVIGDQVSLGQGQLVACLAVTSALTKEVNVALQSVVPTAKWAEMAIADAKVEGIGMTGNPNQRIRALSAFTRRYYDAVAIPDADLRAAGLAAGFVI